MFRPREQDDVVHESVRLCASLSDSGRLRLFARKCTAHANERKRAGTYAIACGVSSIRTRSYTFACECAQTYAFACDRINTALIARFQAIACSCVPLRANTWFRKYSFYSVDSIKLPNEACLSSQFYAISSDYGGICTVVISCLM